MPAGALPDSAARVAALAAMASRAASAPVMTLLTTVLVVLTSPATTHGATIVHRPRAHAPHAMLWVRS